jgi:hypothetical protein
MTKAMLTTKFLRKGCVTNVNAIFFLFIYSRFNRNEKI